MPTELPPPFDPSVLRLAAHVRRLGHDTRAKDDQGAPLWVSVRHGVVVRAGVWDKLSIEHRHAALVHATALRMKERPRAFSHSSAAVLSGLPRVSAWPRQVEVISPARSSGLILRHDLVVEECVEIAGLSVTTMPRTIVDLARTASLHDAVAAADYALHHELCTRLELEAEFARLDPGVPGRARARLVLDFAEAGSMSVGESLSRVQMFRLNLPRPQLQVRVEDEDGLAGICDFGWDGVVGEFDGRKKYRVPDGATSEEAAQVLWREKKREDRIRASDRKMARWVWADAVRPAQMLRILAAQGIRPSAANMWFAEEIAVRHPRRPDAA